MPDRLFRISRDTWRDASRLGVQSGVAAAVAYVGAITLGDLEAFLVIMMAVTSLQRTVGGTIGQALMRMQSALAGSLLGLLCLVLLPEGWGTAVALAGALCVVGVASVLQPAWQLAVVPAVGMSLGDRGDLLQTALVSTAGILMGAAIGTLVSLLVWPDRAEARFDRHYRRALKATATRLSDAVQATVEEGRTPRVAEHVSAWNEAVWLAQEALEESRFVDRGLMQRRLDALRDLHESVAILDRAAEAESPPMSVESMVGEVSALRRNACAVLTGMAEGRRQKDERIKAMDAALEHLRQVLKNESPTAKGHELHSAVAFGLREVRRTLAALAELEAGWRERDGA
ncbi:hypothetical protein [Rubellimicrobium roseum]|uniref:FUSC family protein n=1 Tax=Rubellimicrobium roseum TaxID=687525 RepID=A0A5C4N3A7_9RHOB|nr:hypothetical protein [Rubellimicrobium roseum]TNC59695.1 hypothetical protein FHG71_22590 [Rubellimicrobium roseum]